MSLPPTEPSEAQLSHAGAVTDKAIEYMMGQNLPPVAIASALLGGAITLLARHLSEAAAIGALTNAIESIRAGDLREGA